MIGTMATLAQASAPHHIAPDTYAGRWMFTGVPAGRACEPFTARELAGFAREGIVWEFSGHTRGGRALFHRTRYVATAAGALHLYDSDGRKVGVHPADRIVRVLTKR